MFRANYKATMKNILRSPVTLLALGATIILTIALYQMEAGGASLSGLRQNIWNHIRTTCLNLFPPFIGLMISAHILSEKQNGFGDLLVSSRKSILSIYLSKLCAVGTITLAARAIYLAVELIWFWFLRYPEVYGVSLPFEKILAHYAVNEAIYMPFLLLCYTAMPVFICVITNIPAAGAVWNVGFYLFGYVVTSFKSTDFFLPPQTLDDYLGTYDYIDNPEYMRALQAGLYPNSLGEVPPTLPEALTVYIGWIVFSLALLVAAYFILKRRYRT